MSVFESETSTFHGFNPEMQPQTQMQTYFQETAAAAEENAPRQNSIMSLTLDEIQAKSGKSFGAMNMDEFLANLWTTTVEENNGGAHNKEDGEKPAVLPRQSSLTVPIPLCKKTVDEVWSDIQNGVKQPPVPAAGHDDEDIRRQRTVGEITLEDFLVKAGVVHEPIIKNTTTTMRIASSEFGYNNDFGVGLHCHNNNHQYSNYCENRPVYAESRPVYTENRPIYAENRPFYSVLGESSRCMAGLDSFRIKKRILDGPPEILMERRQRRMIKNRESAARSRARRQAYTVELELELNNLTEENTQLKKIVEENENKRRQELMNRSTKIITKDKSGEKLRRIRRMSSAGW
ncbi:unnamed protein product [Cochlearia groenlandica]